MTGTPSDRDTGAALLLALLVTLLLAALGSGLIVLGDTEAAVAHNHRVAAEVRYAADAAAEHALSVLRGAGSWTDVLLGAVHSPMMAVSSTPVAPWGATLDLQRLTRDLQAESDASASWGANNPAWGLVAAGTLEEALGGATGGAAAYLVVWVADDPSELDDDPSADTNGVVMLRGLALNAFGMRARVQVAVQRVGASVRILSWRLIQ